MSSTGYSGTPLAKKLGITAGCHVRLQNAPAELRDWLAPVPEGVTFQTRVTKDTDLVHLFTTDAKELANVAAQLRKTLRPDAMFWVSWPKKTAKVPTDITEDVIRAIVLPMGWVDVKVCAVSDVWSGLKLVVRKELR